MTSVNIDITRVSQLEWLETDGEAAQFALSYALLMQLGLVVLMTDYSIMLLIVCHFFKVQVADIETQR